MPRVDSSSTAAATTSRLLYGLRPFTVEDWMSDPLRHSGPPTRH